MNIVKKLTTIGAACKSDLENRILRLEEKVGISTNSKDTIDKRTIVFELALGVEEKNKGDTLLDDEHNRTFQDKDASIIDGPEIDLRHEVEINVQVTNRLSKRIQIVIKM